MKVSESLDKIQYTLLTGNPEAEVDEVAYDSRKAAKDAVFFNGDEIERNPGKLLHQWPKPGRTGTAKNVIPLSRQFGICPEKAECNHIPPYY